MELVNLPVELKALLGVIVTIAVTQALKYISGKLGQDLSGYSAQVTAAIISAGLVLINAVLSNIPAEAAPIAQQLLGLVVVLFAAFGIYDKFKLKG